MAMTNKEIERRMDAAWCTYYKLYSVEAEWYSIEDSKVWVCDIPSDDISIKLELDEDKKIVLLYEAPLKKQNNYNYTDTKEWKPTYVYYW